MPPRQPPYAPHPSDLCEGHRPRGSSSEIVVDAPRLVAPVAHSASTPAIASPALAMANAAPKRCIALFRAGGLAHVRGRDRTDHGARRGWERDRDTHTRDNEGRELA